MVESLLGLQSYTEGKTRGVSTIGSLVRAPLEQAVLAEGCSHRRPPHTPQTLFLLSWDRCRALSGG